MQGRDDGPLLPREEAQLMEGLLAGDDAAIRALYARFSRPVYTMGLRLLGSREAAEELTQDVFVTAWRKAARFDPQRGRLSTWLMTIAHNQARNGRHPAEARAGRRGAGIPPIGGRGAPPGAGCCPPGDRFFVGCRTPTGHPYVFQGYDGA